jgi:hypothetical protein
MVSHYILTNLKATRSESARYISVNEKEFMHMDGLYKGIKP